MKGNAKKISDSFQKQAIIKENQENQLATLRAKWPTSKNLSPRSNKFFTSKPPIEAIHAVVPTPRPATPPKPVEKIDGIWICGIPESNKTRASNQENDLVQVQK